VWLVTLAGGWGNGGVLFDEYHHGFGQKRSATALAMDFARTPYGWCVLQLLAAGALFVFGHHRRFGRISERPAPARRSPLEQIDARAGLFQAASARQLAVDAILQQLLAEMSGPLGRFSDLGALRRHLLARTRSSRLEALFDRLQTLYDRVQADEPLSDAQLVEIGRIAGQIPTEVLGER
jgi:hypothetical protein